jgi:peptidase E
MSQVRRPRALVLLGAQRFEPTLGDAVGELEAAGLLAPGCPIAVVTAGWQEREPEDLDLREHLAGRTVNLRLHHRAEQVFADDPELTAAHRERQVLLRHKQDFYRIRLEHALDAHHVVFQRRAPAAVLEEERAASLAAIRQLDELHVAQCEQIHRAFEQAWRPFERASVARHRDEIAAELRGAGALAVAGGNVATLINRLRLFGIADLLEGQVLFAWSAGAMAVSDRVVLFHDSPPQGPGAAEVLERGLGLCPGVVALPQPETRLRLDDPERVSVMARRFAPARCVTLPARARLTVVDGHVTRSIGPGSLDTAGGHHPVVEDAPLSR